MAYKQLLFESQGPRKDPERSNSPGGRSSRDIGAEVAVRAH